MSKESSVSIALTKEACPVCAKAFDGEIVINTRLTKEAAKKVEDLHGKITGFMKHPCKDCRDLLDKGYVLIGVIEEKTQDKNNPFRSGHMWCISNQAAERLFGKETLGERGYAFIDLKMAKQVSLPFQNIG